MSNRRSSKPKRWTYRVGERPLTVTAYERADREGVVSLRYYQRERKDYAKKSLGVTVRDANGQLDPVAVREVQRRATELYNELTLGSAGRSSAAFAAPITLQRGFTEALTVGSGMYATDSQSRREMVQLSADVQSILGPTRTFESIRPTDAPTIWRSIANDVRAGRTRVIHNGHSTRVTKYGGPRMAERAVDLLFRAARWHYDAGHIPTAPQAPRGWQAKLRKDWGDITGATPTPANPRHEWDDLKKMHAVRAKADPRASLLFLLAFEARQGQAVRALRSNLVITPGAGVTGNGTFEIIGRDKKRGAFIDLSTSQRDAIDEAITTGYLRDLEGAWQRGEIADYALFPAGRLRRGCARVSRGSKALTADGLASMFRKWEAAAGVAHQPGRGWYGIRRIAADRAEDETADARVLNFITGHRDSRTRQGYQNERDPAVRRLAAEVREKKRAALSEPDPEPTA